MAEPLYVKTPAVLLRDTSLKLSERVVYLYLSWRQGSNGECWPSRDTIAAELGISIPTVKRAIRTLESRGFIDIRRPNHQGRGVLNHYSVKGVKEYPFPDTKGGQKHTLKGVKNIPVTRTMELNGFSTREKGTEPQHSEAYLKDLNAFVDRAKLAPEIDKETQ